MDFKTMTGPQLVATWNEMVLTAADFGLDVKPVKKFKDQKSGVARCEKLHAQLQAKKPAQDAAPAVPAVDTDEDGIPEFLKRDPKKEPPPKPSPADLVPKMRTFVDTSAKTRDLRVAQNLDEKGLAILAAQAEEKKKKTAERIQKMKDDKKEREAEKLEKANAARKAEGLEELTTLNPTRMRKQETTTMAKKTVKKTAAKKSAAKANGSGKRIDNDGIITKIIKEYPSKQKGTFAMKVWDAIGPKMSPSELYAKMKDPRASAYVRWFVAHQYVKIS
jgi:hypothetical protein